MQASACCAKANWSAISKAWRSLFPLRAMEYGVVFAMDGRGGRGQITLVEASQLQTDCHSYRLVAGFKT
jgi:hypothetical protein